MVAAVSESAGLHKTKTIQTDATNGPLSPFETPIGGIHNATRIQSQRRKGRSYHR